ncbi:hypothetical protein [Dactylosporangium sp. NPDC049140]|uniref:hypothetical protein n=1 Tax=Dactylosporangium sp. NPDC049140 TaxID=3155647 RepID=UPI0033C23C7B
MTNFIEEQLTEGMREQVAGIAVTTDLVGRTLRAQRRRTMVTRTTYAVGVIGLAGALTAGVLTTGGTGPAATRERPPAAGAEPAQVRLAAAISASRGISYRVKNTIIPRSQPGRPSMVVTGVFDPATATGYVRFAAGDEAPWWEERLVDGDLYTADLGHPRPAPTPNHFKPAPSPDQLVDWSRVPGKKYTSLPYDPKGGVLAVSADPEQLLDALAQSGAKISQTGPDKYHFEVTIPPRTGLIDGKVVGDVTVGSDHRVAKVVYEATLRSATETGVVDETLELSDYGSPVTVERPGVTTEELPGKPSK